jgi:hypothetical protein
MFKQILFPFDFCAQGLQAVPFVHLLASELRATSSNDRDVGWPRAGRALTVLPRPV